MNLGEYFITICRYCESTPKLIIKFLTHWSGNVKKNEHDKIVEFMLYICIAGKNIFNIEIIMLYHL